MNKRGITTYQLIAIIVGIVLIFPTLYAVFNDKKKSNLEVNLDEIVHQVQFNCAKEKNNNQE